ncbi:NUDIX hydrolase [Flindersiella endophytica]
MSTSRDGLPDWLHPVADLAARITPEELAWPVPPNDSDRESAILLLFGEAEQGPDLLLIERSHSMRSHAGQPAFPGGAVDPTDEGPVAAALREAEEETGLDPSGVEVFGQLPVIHILPSRYAVTPVLGWWRKPSPVGVVDPAEVASVHRVPLADLTDPANRFRVRHRSGYVGPAFGVAGLVVWGFTGILIDRVLGLLGWEQPWDRSIVRDLPETLS